MSTTPCAETKITSLPIYFPEFDTNYKSIDPKNLTNNNPTTLFLPVCIFRSKVLNIDTVETARFKKNQRIKYFRPNFWMRISQFI